MPINSASGQSKNSNLHFGLAFSQEESNESSAVRLFVNAMIEAGPRFIYRLVGEEGFAAVRPLWEKLKAYHSHLSWRFASEMNRHTFEPRKQEILAKAAAGRLRIELVSTATAVVDVAYCISTVSVEGRGEIDSIFVEECFRGCGIGSELLRRALAWLDTVGAASKVVTVAYGNEEAMALYQRFGFHPRTILLQQHHTPNG